MNRVEAQLRLDDGEPEPGNYAALLRKYRALCAKYRDLVARLETRVHEQVGVYNLAFWTLKLTSSAVALVRRDAVTLSNDRFDELSRRCATSGTWRARPRTGDTTRSLTTPTFRALAIGLAGALDDSPGAPQWWYAECSGLDTLLEVRCEPLGIPGRPMTAVMALDVTERVQRERELERAREALSRQQRVRALGELASGVAHDLNNVLGTLSLRIATLESPRASEADRAESLRALRRVLGDATSMVRRLQEFGRPAGSNDEEGPVDPAAVVSDAIALVRSELEERTSLRGAPVCIETDLRPLPPVRGSAPELRHAVINLLLNARDAMPSGGTLWVSVRPEGDCARIEVRDEGVGIAPENLPRVFDPFFTTKGRDGVGLGLANAKRAVDAAGGTITAANVAGGGGQGAVFTIRLPFAARPGASSGAGAAEVNAAPVPPQRVLLVDNDQGSLEAARGLLRALGHAVDVARSGHEATELLRAGRRYDLVLCDLGMPDVSGWAVAREMRQTMPRASVYLLSGWGPEAANAASTDVHGVLAKPLDAAALRDVLARGAEGEHVA